jgi:3-methyladenine DNA glycosylase AlkD
MSDLKTIQKILIENASPEGKAAHEKFVPGLEKAYGTRAPVINALAKQYKDRDFNLVEELWQGEHIEEKILAGKLLGQIAKKNPEKTLTLIKKFSKDISDWAVCDTLGMQGPKKLNKSHAKEIFQISNTLIHSKNLWQRRLALVLVEWYTRDKKFHPAIKQLVKKVENDKEYYVKKAVVWINRNFSKGR